MTTMKKYILTLISLVFIFQATNAQVDAFDDTNFNNSLDSWIINVEWGLGMPTGDFDQFLDGATSSRSFYIEVKKVLGNHFAVGGGVGWQGYNKKFDRNTYEFNNGALTTTLLNYMYLVPFRLTGNYYPLKNTKLQPYLGLSAGLYSTSRRTDLGLYEIEENHWNFGVSPEVGVNIPIGTAGWGVVAKYRYNYIIYNYLEFDNLSSMDFSVGILLTY